MAGIFALVPVVAAWFAFVGSRGCGYDGRFCPGACEVFDAHVSRHIVGQVSTRFLVCSSRCRLPDNTGPVCAGAGAGTAARGSV